jgi:hypothetical protein
MTTEIINGDRGAIRNRCPECGHDSSTAAWTEGGRTRHTSIPCSRWSINRKCGVTPFWSEAQWNAQFREMVPVTMTSPSFRGCVCRGSRHTC